MYDAPSQGQAILDLAQHARDGAARVDRSLRELLAMVLDQPLPVQGAEDERWQDHQQRIEEQGRSLGSEEAVRVSLSA